MKIVELHLAFTWTCDDCGRDNYDRGITISPEQESGQQFYKDYEKEILAWIESGGTGDFVIAPKKVVCKHCGIKFKAKPL